MRKIPLVDLGRQYQVIGKEIHQAIKKVAEESAFVLGEELEKFEKEFAKFCQVKYCVGVASGTDALLLGMKAAGIGLGDEVITVSNTFISTALSITYTGAKPVFVEINPRTYNFDVNQIEKKINKKTKAILPVHLYGQPVEMTPIMKLAKKYKLMVFEDACQAHGATYKGKKAGSFGDFAAFSFYVSKNLGAWGDAGALVTNRARIAKKVRLMRNVGREGWYEHKVKGYNSRLDNLQAAVLRVKLPHLASWTRKRRQLAKLYDRLLSPLEVVIPFAPKYLQSAYYLYVIRVKKRDQLLEFLKTKGIFCGLHYPVPIHLQKAYQELGMKKGSLPITEKCAQEIISLPLFPELTKEEIQYIVSKIAEFQKKEK